MLFSITHNNYDVSTYNFIEMFTILFLGNYGKELEDNESYSEIFNCYENTLKIFPNNEILLNNLGSHLIR